MLVKTYCVYKYRVHFESLGLKTVLRKFKVFELPWKDNKINIMHSLVIVASVILNVDGLKGQLLVPNLISNYLCH